MESIILIGMPGAGKSTIGVILAKAAGLRFCDTDLLLQQRENKLLQQVIDQRGIAYFKQSEEQCILAEDFRRTVVATGGSVVYSQKSMEHMAKFGVTVFLEVPLQELARRVKDFSSRGVIGEGGLARIYEERMPLYRRYAQITIGCAEKGAEQIVSEILKRAGMER